MITSKHGNSELARVAAIALLLAVIIMVLSGCHKTPFGKGGDYHQRELMLVFVAAHDKQDLNAEENLVDWDNVTEATKRISSSISSRPSSATRYSRRTSLICRRLQPRT